MINEHVKATGTLTIVKNGARHYHADNLVVGTGLAFIAAKILEQPADVMSHMAVGEGAANPNISETTLILEAGRVAFDSTAQVTTNVNNDSVQFVASFLAGVGTGALTEAGIFSAASGGTMLSRTAFPVVNKQALDSISITWKIVIT